MGVDAPAVLLGALVRLVGARREIEVLVVTLGLVGPGLVRGWRPDGQILRTYVNGKVVQESSLNGMIWDVGYLVTDLARMITLLPGDLILSGTPANSPGVIAPIPAPVSAFCINNKSWMSVMPSRFKSPSEWVNMSPI